jgi:hypothetical protein
MPPGPEPQLLVAAGMGIVGGLSAFAGGLAAYRRAGRVAGIASSRVVSLAAGEIRVTGTVVPLAMTLVSPLQSVPCVWYRASITERDGGDTRPVLDRQRAVEFALRDETGDVRVIPHGARWEFAPVFSESTDAFGEDPVGLMLDRGSGMLATPADREAAVAALLTVRRPTGSRGLDDDGFTGLRVERGSREYVEARLEPGQVVTVVGHAVPFGQLAESQETTEPAALDDAALQADLAEARANGTLVRDASAAWGNAAIPGFGIGRPTRLPVLHPEADSLAPATPEQSAHADRVFEIAPETLVLAAAVGVPLTIYPGTPADAVARDDRRFYLGLAGAVLAIVSAVALALMVRGVI